MNQNLFLMTVMVVLLVVAVFFTANQRDTLKKQAIELGYAEWKVESDGTTTFRWKEGGK